jgi:hypothetical protein
MQEREIMSSDAFILPALPQTPASGLNATAAKGPAAFKSNPLRESSDPCESFSATLSQISDRHNNKPKAANTEKPGVTSRGSDKDSASEPKISNTIDLHHNQIEEGEAPVSPETPLLIHPQQVFGLMPFDLMNVSMVDDGSWAVEPPSGSTAEPILFMLNDLIGHLHPQWQQVEGEHSGIGPFEQLQANISPEATNRAFFEFWQGMFPSASTAQEGTINGQPELSGINGNAPLNSLLQMLGMGTTDAAGDLNLAAGQEGAHLDGALLDRLTALFQSAQANVSENAKIAATGHDGGLSSWATGNSNSETLLEAQARQMSDTSQPLKIQETLKAAAEHPANPNSATEGITAKTPEEVFGIRSAVQKSEMVPVDALGNKISQIDGDSKDSGFLFSQDQMPQHLARLENSAHSSEATQRSLMPQTLDQIVQKAVLSLHNGQHEVELHLKPDFLGHIQMRIVSEGQQVAIKMVADLPFVKDMLENNLHQLKADLQAQGLDIDELEVSVAHDSHAKGDFHQNAAAAKLEAVKNGTDSDDGSSEEPGQTQARDGGPMAETAIDFFA